MKAVHATGQVHIAGSINLVMEKCAPLVVWSCGDHGTAIDSSAVEENGQHVE